MERKSDEPASGLKQVEAAQTDYPARPQQSDLAGCSKRSSNETAGELKPEAYPQGYVEDFDEPRTKLGAFFSSRQKNAMLAYVTVELYWSVIPRS